MRPAATIAVVAALGLAAGPQTAQLVRWADLPAGVQRRLADSGIDAATLPAFLDAHERRTTERVREGDLDALVYYALQSTSFTGAPPIEPALDAKAFVETLPPDLRARLLAGQASPVDRVPAPARRRLKALADAARSSAARGRLRFFGDVIRSVAGPRGNPETVLLTQYVRAMRFLYEKEFLAPQQADRAAAVAALYRDRALSTDTSVEAGYLVHLGLATVAAVDPGWRVQRVLVVGPGLDLAPRTGLVEVGEPESYQPHAVVDSLVGLGIARTDRLTVVCADVNPRVVDHLNAVRSRRAALSLVTAIAEQETVRFDEDFRRYFDGLGRATADILEPPELDARDRGHLRKAIRVSAEASRVIAGIRLDVVRERTVGDPFDLVIVTNVFPYLNDTELTLALANVAAALRAGGVLLHNEARPLIGDVTTELLLPLTHSRTAIIATVRGSSAPLYDRVFVHVKR